MRRKLIRNAAVAIFFMPVILYTYLSSIFIGRQKTMEIVGPKLTRAAKRSLRYWVPRLDVPGDFSKFAPTMKSRMRYWKIIYDVEVTEETDDLFKIKVTNCPFCEVLAASGLRELRTYMCEGDWAMARANSDKWSFERKHQIGTGDAFCDHTYMRKKDR
jgi:hypothetical protein